MVRVSLLLAMANVALAAPNVVVVLTDDQGYGDLSCHGNPHLETPRLDALREESTAFERFFVSPTCAPTRAALLTGRHEFACGVSHTIAGRSLLRPDLPTVAEVFRDAGYATGIFGKWHLGENLPCRPEDRGFETVFVHGNGGIGQTGDYWGSGYFDPHVRTRDGWVKTEGYCTDVFFGEAISWMEKQEKPFFLWLATNAPHSPYISPKDAEQKFLKAGLKNPAASFYAMIENIDANMAKLLGVIDEGGLEEETIVVFLTDNGSALGHWNAGMKGRKGSADEGGVRVPCFVRWPGRIEAGRKVAAPAAHLDLMETLAGLCGIADVPETEGADLSEALLGKAEFPTERKFFTNVGRWPGDQRPDRFRTRNFSIRDDRWRLAGLSLFDMVEDPGQEHNVHGENPEVAAALLVDYGRWWDSVIPMLREPVRYRIGDERQPVVRLTAHDWWPSLMAEEGWEIGKSLWHQDSVTKHLRRVQSGQGDASGRTGHWKLEVARDGNYRLEMSLLPEEAGESELAKLKAGTAHVRTGRQELQMKLADGTRAAALNLDLKEGPVDLEVWFEGQLAGGEPLGAPFVKLERVGGIRFPIPEIDIRIEKP